MITITKGDGIYIIRFPYDPDTIVKIKGIPGRKWDPGKKHWTVPLAGLRDLKQIFPDAMFPMEDVSVGRQKDIVVDYGDYEPLTVPYGFQKIGASKLSQEDGALFDDCGLGKSRQALDAFGILRSKGEAKRMLVICPANLTRNWAEEIEKHSPFSYFIIDGDRPNVVKRPWTSNLASRGARPQGAELEGHVLSHDIAVINYEKVRVKRFLELLQRLVQREDIDVICCDEAHKIKNRGAKQTQAVISLRANRCWAMTATPVANHPEDIQPLGDWVTHDRAFGGWQRFNRRYCIWGQVQVNRTRTVRMIVGYKSQAELRDTIASFSLRRLKDEVLDLPPKTFSHRYFAMTLVQERAYEQMKRDFIAWLKHQDGSERPLTARAILAQLIRLNQIASNLYIVGGTDEGGKFDGLSDLAEDLIYNNHKLVVWSHWVNGVVLANMRLGQQYRGVMLHGGVPQARRQELVNQFQEDPETKYFVGNPDCAGLGLNLFAADTELVIDSGYSWIQYAQAVDRCHRIGQRNSVTIINMIATYRDGRPTIDEMVFKKLRAKAEMAGGLLGDDDSENPFANVTQAELIKAL